MVITALAAGLAFAQQPLFDNWNQDSCNLTDTVAVRMERATWIQEVSVWYLWGPTETSLSYSISAGPEVVHRGTLARGDCGTETYTWCQAREALDLRLPPGTYTFLMMRQGVCSNTASGDNGFLRLIGSYSDEPAATAPSPPTARAPIGPPVTRRQDVSLGSYHLRVTPGWTLPASTAKSQWSFRYMANLRNGPASPVTPLTVSLYIHSMPYSGEGERQAAVEELRSAVWRGANPAVQKDTMKLAGVKADRLVQKGNAGSRFYLFPYNGAEVYCVYVFVPGDTPEIPPEALQLLETLKIDRPKSPPKTAVAAPQEKAPKDYLKNVGAGLNLFPAEAERELGLAISNDMNQHLSLIEDADTQSYVESLGARLVAASRNPQLECRFFVVNSSEVNAFSLPGCFVYVNRALIDLTQTEGQLAGVISHEIGHVIGRHVGKQLSRKILLLGLVQGVSALVDLKNPEAAGLISSIGGYGAMLATLKFGRDDEHQADALGAETMAAAAYDPHDLVDFFRRLEPGATLDVANRIMGIQSTHPITADREKTLLQQIARMSYGTATESQVSAAFQSCRTRLAEWPMPPVDRDVTLSAALAATGIASDPGK